MIGDDIGALGWSASTNPDGVRLTLDLEDLGRVGLLLVTKGLWDGNRIIPESFVDQLITRQTTGIPPNYDNANDGHTGLLVEDFPDSPYGLMTWVNTDQNLYPGAAATWALGYGGGGHHLAFDPDSGIVLAIEFGDFVPIPGNPPGWPTPVRIAIETIQQNITGPNPLVTTDTTPPTAPGALSATALGQSVQLDWTAASDPETGIASHNVYRGTLPGGSKTLIGQAPGAQLSFLDDTTAPSTPYYYEVTAVNGAALEGAASAEATATTGDDPPAAPVGLVATGGDGQVSLDWADNLEPDLSDYFVHRAEVAGGPYTQIAGPLGASAYLDAAVVNGTAYYYVVTAADAAGNVSANSAEATATPGIDPGLAAHWRLDEGTGGLAADAVGSSNGTIFGATWGTGVSGAALDFDGVNAHVVIDNTAALEITGTEITLAAWINPRDGGAAGGSRAISKRTDAGGADVYSMYTYQNRLCFRLDGQDMISNHVFTANQWLHVAMVYNGVDKRIYVNGALDNDGDLDLVFAGDDEVYLNQGDGTFVEGPSVPISGINDPRAVAFADIDDDGDLDFAIAAKLSRNWLVRNDFNDGNWLKVELVSPQGQAGAFGAWTFVYPAGQIGGTLIGMRESKGNYGYLGQDDPVLHFGLGSNTLVDVVVEFVDGSQVTQTNVSANQLLVIDGSAP